MPLLRCGKLQVKVSDARSSHHCHHQSPSLSHHRHTVRTYEVCMHTCRMHTVRPICLEPYLFGAREVTFS